MRDAKKVYKITGIITIVLYIVGIFTGYSLYHWTESRTSEEIEDLKAELWEFNTNLEKLQTEQLYLTSYQGELGCRFLVSSIDSAQDELQNFIQKLPGKLEVHERYNQIDPVYEAVKADYMRASLRIWLLTLSVMEKCNTTIVPVVFFYTANEDSIKQGYVLDGLRAENPDLKIFTIDLNLEDDMVKTIKEVYEITSAPSLLIKEQLLEGFQEHEELSGIIGNN